MAVSVVRSRLLFTAPFTVPLRGSARVKVADSYFEVVGFWIVKDGRRCEPEGDGNWCWNTQELTHE